MRYAVMRNAVMLALLGLAGAAPAQVVIYRCTDASGAVTIQNDTPCPKGSQQQRRVVGAAPTGSLPPVAAPAPAPHPTPHKPAPPVERKAAPPAPAMTRDTAVDDADRLPPPVLYECRTYDNGRYLSDDAKPPPRCAPLRVTDLGGGDSRVAGSACQTVEDQCQRIPDGALCENWRQRLREAESQLRFGVVDQREQAQAEVDRMQRIVRESTCGR